MSGFDEFVEKAKKVATRAACETVKFTDVTTTKVKIKAEEAKLCERYERLGRAAYKMLSEMSVVSDEIAEALGEVENERVKIKELEAVLAEKRAKYSEKSEENKETANTQSEEGPTETETANVDADVDVDEDTAASDAEAGDTSDGNADNYAE